MTLLLCWGGGLSFSYSALLSSPVVFFLCGTRRGTALSEDEPRSHDVLNGLAGYLSALLFVRTNTRE